ncbi:unnamed protein product [Cylicocyclus nassatus]|uniref:Methyltransferase FkbM domain-containing protein n=1 Tax=Cylicocyclus nassatus TaxID=53992 RepID=A0AA36H897_CYLNA|nr:unnamed protein product [Cylicocyclus nassatus]
MIRIRQPKLSKLISVLSAIIPLLVLVAIYRRATPTRLNIRDVDPRVRERFHDWKQCIEKELTYLNDSDILWLEFWKGIKLCETLPSMQQLVIGNFQNRDDTKRHIVSLQNTPSIVVSLGIGHDTAAEEALQKVLPEGSQFYGADPMREVNEELYSKFGTFLPFAVGAKSGITSAKVLINNEYVERSVIQIELIYLLTEIIGHKVYDNLWIDTEGAEYDLFSYFFRDGKLDQHGITICQFNMEVTFGQEEPTIQDFGKSYDVYCNLLISESGNKTSNALMAKSACWERKIS